MIDIEDLRNSQLFGDPNSGRYGAVFRLQSRRDSKKHWAVKCFMGRATERNQPHRHERYRLLDAHFNGHYRPRFMVDFAYLSHQQADGHPFWPQRVGEYRDALLTPEDNLGTQGVFIDGLWFPVVAMDWVEGQTLRDIVEPRLGMPQTFDALCRFCESLARDLTDSNIAHLDLHHGNVLWQQVLKGKFAPKLIDYDGMWTETVAGLPSREGALGHYQHPDRDAQRLYCPELDRFSHLVIYTALRGLGLLPTLWQRFDNGANLLFTEQDFQACRDNGAAATESLLLQDLWDQSDTSLRYLTGRLILAAHGPVQATPELAEVVEGSMDEALLQPLGEQVEDICPWLPRHYRRKPAAGSATSEKECSFDLQERQAPRVGAEIRRCPFCQRTLKVPDESLGQQVTCPSCDRTFVANTQYSKGQAALQRYGEFKTVTPAPESKHTVSPPRPPMPYSADALPSGQPHYPRRDFRAHHGELVLVLGIFGIALLMCFGIGIFFAIPVWIVSSIDLKKMQKGTMDPRGKGITHTGQILGIVGTIIGLLGWGLYVVGFFIGFFKW